MKRCFRLFTFISFPDQLINKQTTAKTCLCVNQKKKKLLFQKCMQIFNIIHNRGNSYTYAEINKSKVALLNIGAQHLLSRVEEVLRDVIR